VCVSFYLFFATYAHPQFWMDLHVASLYRTDGHGGGWFSELHLSLRARIQHAQIGMHNRSRSFVGKFGASSQQL